MVYVYIYIIYIYCYIVFFEYILHSKMLHNLIESEKIEEIHECFENSKLRTYTHWIRHSIVILCSDTLNYERDQDHYKFSLSIDWSGTPDLM